MTENDSTLTPLDDVTRLAPKDTKKINEDEKTRLQNNVNETLDGQIENESTFSREDDATRLVPRDPARLNIDEDRTKLHPTADHATKFNTSINVQGDYNAETITVGTTIKDRFLLKSLIGAGGMGMVFSAIDKRKEEARDRDMLVAIKILSDAFKDHPKAFISLQREAKKSQSLAHPNIINVYDFDRDQDTIFMTMEQLYGETLDHFIKKYPTGAPSEQAKNIISQMANALEYAHSKNIIHSDLKPSNVFLTNEGNVKILDFGIARAISGNIDAEDDQTLFDAVELGGLTPAYASKEMHEGLDPAAGDDIYALGLISYELLSGKHPYKRRPANKVTEQDGISRRRPPNIKRHQWKAIQHAIIIEQNERTKETSAFIKEFEGLSKVRLSLLAFAGLLITLTSLNLILDPAPQGPKIPFESLPAAQQSTFSKEVSLADTAISFSDLNGALHHLSRAYEIHPRNPDALKRFDDIVSRVMKDQKESESLNAASRQLRQIDVLLNYEALKSNSILLNRRTELLSLARKVDSN